MTKKRAKEEQQVPDMQYVDSSNIEAIGYDGASRELHVRFLNGATYVYSDVEDGVFEELLQAPSKGSYLNRNIKGRYQYAKL